jgi:hypothetical protein
MKFQVFELNSKWYVGAEGHIVSVPLDSKKEAEEFIASMLDAQK